MSTIRIGLRHKDNDQPPYSVQVMHPRGYAVVIAGRMTPTEVMEQVEIARNRYGFTRMDLDLPTLLGGDVVTVVGTPEGLADWRAEWVKLLPSRFPGQPVQQWFNSPTCSASSRWLVSVLTGEMPPGGAPPCVFPSDLLGFTRCVDALRLFNLDDDRLPQRWALVDKNLSKVDKPQHCWRQLIPKWSTLAALVDTNPQRLEQTLSDIGRLNPTGPRDAIVRSRSGVSFVLSEIVSHHFGVAFRAWRANGCPGEGPSHKTIHAAIVESFENDPDHEIDY